MTRRSIACLAGILAISSSACVDLTELLPPYKQSPRDIDYIERVKAQPLDFQVAASEDAVAWKRARDILTKLGPDIGGCRELRVSTAAVLEMSPGKTRYAGGCKDGEGFAYKIVREPHDNVVDYSISYCTWIWNYGGARDDSKRGDFSYDSKRYAQLMAYYIVSGKKRLGAIWHD